MSRHVVLWDVFISHSTSPQPQGPAARLLKQLVDAFPLRSCRAQADCEFLHLGDPWEEGIRDAINDSHIGLVLLDHNALRSKWVRREVRHMLDQPRHKNYRIITVLVDIDRAKVEQSCCEEFVHLVTELQTTTIKADDVAGTCARLLALLQTEVFRDITAREMALVRGVAKFLPTDEIELMNMIKVLDERAKPPPLLTREVLAYRILRAELTEQVRRMFKRSKNDFLSRLSDTARERLTDLIEPSWIELGLARLLVPEPDPGPRVCVLGTSNPVTETGIRGEAGLQFVRRATHWDEEEVEVHRCDDVPVGDPAEIGPLLRAQYDWEDEDGTNYLVLEAGRTRSSRLNGFRAVQDIWPNVVVVLVIGPDTDPDAEEFEKHLGQEYGRAMIEHQRELDARTEITRIRKHLAVRKQT